MERKYETVVIFDGSLSDEVIETEQKKVEKFLQDNTNYEGTDVWGKKNLAYEIKKKKTGNYYLYIYKADGNIDEKLNKLFKLDRKILRHMTVLYDEAPDISSKTIPPEPVVEEGEE